MTQREDMRSGRNSELLYSQLAMGICLAWNRFLLRRFLQALLHRRPLTPDGLTPQPYYTGNLLHQKPFTPEAFYTRRVLHQRRFTPQPFYAAKLLSTRESLLHQNQSTQTLHTRNFLHQRRFPSDPGLTLNAGSPICVLQSRLVLQVRLPVGIDTSPLLLSSIVALVVRYIPYL